MTYTDIDGQIYLLGLEDAETYRTYDAKGRDESERMHKQPVKVEMKNVEGVKFKKLRCSFIDSYGITDDGYVYKWVFISPVRCRWNWLNPPTKVKLLQDIVVEDISFAWKHTMVLGTPR